MVDQYFVIDFFFWVLNLPWYFYEICDCSLIELPSFLHRKNLGLNSPPSLIVRGKEMILFFFFFFFEKENDIVDVKDTVQFHSSWTYLSDLEILSIWLRLSLDWKQSLIHQILLDGWDGTCNARNMQEIGMQVKP